MLNEPSLPVCVTKAESIVTVAFATGTEVTESTTTPLTIAYRADGGS